MQNCKLSDEQWKKIETYFPDDGTDWDGVSFSTRQRLIELISKYERLDNKFQLLLKYLGRDVVSTIKYVLELEEEINKLKEKSEASQIENP